LKYRVIAGLTDIYSIEENIYKNGELYSSTKEVSSNPPTIQKLNAKEFIINLNEETGLNNYVVEIIVTDIDKNYLSEMCDIVFDLP